MMARSIPSPSSMRWEKRGPRWRKPWGAPQNRKLAMQLPANPPTDTPSIQKVFESMRIPPGRIYSLASARFAYSPMASSVYLDKVNILSEHSWLRQAPPAGQAGASDKPPAPFVLLDAFDIVNNPVGVVEQSDKGSSFQIRMQQGIADTAAESAVLRAGGASEQRASAFSNASDQFAADLGRQQSWISLRQGD